jgi:hypothetical protein
MRHHMVAIVIFIGSAYSATAQTTVDDLLHMDCTTRPAYEHQLDRIEKELASLMIHVERVPPKDAEFIEREIKASLQTGNKARHKAALANQFYFAYQVHKAYELVANDLRIARKIASFPEQLMQSRAVVLVRALSNFVELYEAASYYAVQGQPDKAGQMMVSTLGARDLLVLLINCNVRLLKEP